MTDIWKQCISKNEYSEWVICDDNDLTKKWCSEFENVFLTTQFFVIFLEAFQQWGLWHETIENKK